MIRRIAVTLALTGVLAAASAWSQSKVTRVVVAFPAGGPVDFVARTIAEQLGRELNQSVIVENKPGGNGAIAAQAVMQSQPDGTTLWLSSVGAAAINPVPYEKLAYDMQRDFAPVSRAEQGLPGVDSNNWYALFVPAKTPPATIAALNDAVRRTLATPCRRRQADREGHGSVTFDAGGALRPREARHREMGPARQGEEDHVRGLAFHRMSRAPFIAGTNGVEPALATVCMTSCRGWFAPRAVERFYNASFTVPVPMSQVTDALRLSGGGTHLADNTVTPTDVPPWTGQEDHEIDVFRRRDGSPASHERRVRAHEQLAAAHLAHHSSRSSRKQEGSGGDAQVA